MDNPDPPQAPATDPEWFRPLLDALEESLGNLPYACKKAKVHESTVQRAMEEWADLRSPIENAAEIGRGALVAAAVRWATKGIKLEVLDKFGRCVGYRMDLSEKMMHFLLSTFIPQVRPEPIPVGDGGDEDKEPPAFDVPART